jgi:hypothetical protein
VNLFRAEMLAVAVVVGVGDCGLPGKHLSTRKCKEHIRETRFRTHLHTNDAPTQRNDPASSQSACAAYDLQVRGSQASMSAAQCEPP